MTDNRIRLIRSWLDNLFEGQRYTLVSASADASFRRYFRVNWPQGQAIVMDAPPEREDSKPFFTIAKAMRAIGLNVPEIIVGDCERGLALLSDLGSLHYLQALNDETADRLYDEAMAALLRLQIGALELDLPDYDETLLQTEMSLFPDWLLARQLGLELDDTERATLDETRQRLTSSALEQPKVTVHRDYHSRNLMALPEGGPGIIDFQDAVIGPVTYDLVSLLRDCYIAWPEERVTEWVNRYFERARAADLIGRDIEQATFTRWFDWMGLQRHLKAAGIFARLNLRDGKPGYLDDIPRTLGYLCRVSARYPELEGFHNLMVRVVINEAGTREKIQDTRVK